VNAHRSIRPPPKDRPRHSRLHHTGAKEQLARFEVVARRRTAHPTIEFLAPRCISPNSKYSPRAGHGIQIAIAGRAVESPRSEKKKSVPLGGRLGYASQVDV